MNRILADIVFYNKTYKNLKPCPPLVIKTAIHLHYSVIIRSVTDDNMREGGILPSLLKTAVQFVTFHGVKSSV